MGFIKSSDKNSSYLHEATQEVEKTLEAKKDIWTRGQGVFENFDIANEFGVKPIQFALTMCRIKMNRLKSRWEGTEHIEEDEDAYDSLKDLACYAVLAMALIKRSRYSTNIDTKEFLHHYSKTESYDNE